MKRDFVENYKLSLESSLTKVEAYTHGISDELKEIKKTLRWLVGLVFRLNTTIIGFLIKGFGVL